MFLSSRGKSFKFQIEPVASVEDGEKRKEDVDDAVEEEDDEDGEDKDKDKDNDVVWSSRVEWTSSERTKTLATKNSNSDLCKNA